MSFGIHVRSKALRDRNIRLSFLGIEIIVVAPPLRAELLFCLHSALKSTLWNTKGKHMVRLPYEEWILGEPNDTW